MSLQRQVGYAQIESNDAIVTRLAQQDKVPWYGKPNLRLLYLLMFPTCLGVEITVGFDVSLVNGLQAVPSWLEYFHHPHSASLGFMVASYSLGYIVAIPLVPFVVDKMGRRYPICLAGVISIIGASMQGFALNETMFILGRFILGFVGVFSVVAASSLVGELSHPNERAVMGSLFSCSFNLGAVASAGLVLATFAITNDWGWRIPSFLQVVPSILQVTFIWFLPESPRWLISRGRRNEAYGILVKYHAEGDENSEFVKEEYAQIEQTLEAERKTAETKWKEVFLTPGMRKRVIVAIFLGLCKEWCGVGLLSHFLSLILENIGIHDNRTKNVINFTRGCWGFVNGTLCAFIAPRYPRRWIFLTSTISIFIVFTAWTMASAEYSLTHDKMSAQVALALIFLYSLPYNLGFTVIIYAFLVELFPFHVRTKGISIYLWWSRVAGFIALVANPIGISAVGWKWYIVYCVWNAFQVVFVYFMLPETSGRTLEELSFLYESDQETFRRSEAETLREHGETETRYGTMEDHR